LGGGWKTFPKFHFPPPTREISNPSSISRFPVVSKTSSKIKLLLKREPFKGVLILQVPELNFQDAVLDIRTRELNFLFSGP
jgi:hypothetical protein